MIESFYSLPYINQNYYNANSVFLTVIKKSCQLSRTIKILVLGDIIKWSFMLILNKITIYQRSSENQKKIKVSE